MVEVFIKNLGKIKKLKARLEKSLDASITIQKDNVNIESKGDAMAEYIGEKILEAIDIGFDFNSAMHLKSEEFMMERINLKSFARQSRLRMIRGRVIGKSGRALKTLSTLSECRIKLTDSELAVIGRIEDVDVCIAALKKLIGGAPHSKVYAFLERSRATKLDRVESDEVILRRLNE